MSRNYMVTPTTYEDRFTQKVIQPDSSLVNTLHRLLDTIPNEMVALSIDMCVYELLKFHNPNRPMPFTPKELVAMQERTNL